MVQFYNRVHLISSARPIVNPGTFLMGFTNCNLTLRTFKGGTVKNIAKGTTDTRVEFSLPKLLLQVTHHKFNQTSANTNLDQISSPKSRTSIDFKISTKISTKPSFRILTQIQLHNLCKRSAKKKTGQPQILPELQLQNLDQTLCSRSAEQKFTKQE